MLTRTKGLGSLIATLAGDTIFSVCFTKRSTGEVREMRCRLGTTNKLHGGELTYDKEEKKLLPVWDVDAEGWRSIPLDNLIWLQVRGIKYDANGKEIE